MALLQTQIGTIQTMTVASVGETTYQLTNDLGKATLIKDGQTSLTKKDTVQVFLYADKEGNVLASTHLPPATRWMFGWGKIAEVIPNLGAFINLQTDIEILVSKDELPEDNQLWPHAEDDLYVYLQLDKKNRLTAVPAKESEFQDLFEFAADAELNDKTIGTVIRPGEEGTVILTENGHRGFIHHTERKVPRRLGERVEGRIIEVKEDGTLNISLFPMKHERMDEDAQIIFDFLQEQGGVIPFSNQTDPEEVRATFNMSKSAFKRALGRLMKEGKVKQESGNTILLENK